MASADTRPWNSRVIAVANNKGGVLKTSLSENLAGYLAAAGFSVLLVGCDGQVPAIMADLGRSEDDDGGESLAAAIITGSTPKIVRDVRPNLDVIMDGLALENVVKHAYMEVGRHQDGTGGMPEEGIYELLAPVLQPLAPDYDMILIDCAPGTRVLVAAALGAARWVLIPTRTDLRSVDAMVGTAGAFQEAQTVNPDLGLLGIVITGSSRPSRVAREHAITDIVKAFGGDDAPLFKSYVRYVESPSDNARRQGLLSFELETAEKEAKERKPWYAELKELANTSLSNSPPPRRAWHTNSTGLAGDYQQVTEELVQRITQEESQR